MQFVDIGINLAHDSYDADRPAVLARAEAARVTRMIVTGASPESTVRALELAQAHPGRLWSTAGCHPHHASDCTAAVLADFERIAGDPAVVALGECGLDYFRDFSPRPAQRAAFEAQLDVAIAVGKPVFLHERDAHDDVVACLKPRLGRLRRAVAHCFTGGRRELLAYLDLGLYIGITGWICDERRGAHLKELMPLIPAGRLMIETDGPYLLPRDLNPKPSSRRNEPAWLPHIASTIAAARGETLETLSRHTTETAIQFFGLT